MVSPIVLVALTLKEQHAFVTEQVADYAEWLIDRGEAADPAAALARARAEIEPEIEAAVQAGEEFWAAHDAQGVTVGWLWVKPSLDGLPPDAACLYQILVKAELRRQGYGTAMLTALEYVLAAAGRRELRLNVWDTNMAGRCLYERAGYELAEQFPAKRQLRKRLVLADSSEKGATW
jgi:ribosomal protein S18 acetylase RimI-like enzyme